MKRARFLKHFFSINPYIYRIMQSRVFYLTNKEAYISPVFSNVRIALSQWLTAYGSLFAL